MDAAPLSMSEVLRVASVASPWCVSVYSDDDTWLRGNHRNEAAEVQIRLAAHAMNRAGAPAHVIAAVRAQMERAASPSRPEAVSFDHRIRSVGIFATPESCDVFALATLPAPRVHVSNRFVIGPLLDAALALGPRICVLAASENAARLVDVTSYPARLIEVPDLPQDLASTVNLDLTHDRQTLAHRRISEEPKERLRVYAKALLRAVHEPVRHAKAMLAIVAAEPLASLLHAEADPQFAALAPVPGNPDRLSLEDLANLVTPRADAHRERARRLQISRLENTDPGLVLADVAQIHAALRNGAVDTLFVDPDPQRAVDDDRPESADRADELIREALATDATIVPLRAGDPRSTRRVAAILRYRVAE